MAIIWKWWLNWNANALVWPNGTATNITWVDWKSNLAASFKTNTSQVLVSNIAWYELQTFTWNIKVKLEWTTYTHLVYKKNGSVSFYVGYDVTFTTTWFGFYQQNWNAYTLNNKTLTWTFQQNKFYDITLIKEPTSWKAYVDWVFFGSITAPNVIYLSWNKDTFHWKNPATTAETLNGILDEIIFYDTALSATEIKNKYLFYNWFI